MPTATLISEQLDTWAPGTRHYSASDGKHLAVEASEDAVVELYQVKILPRPTVVFLCNADGQPVDADENDHDPLTPLHVFPSGTTHEDALTQAGYTLGE